MKKIGGGTMGKRKLLFEIGVLFLSIGLLLSNFYSDIPSPFPNLHKGIGISIVIIGLFCLILSHLTSTESLNEYKKGQLLFFRSTVLFK